MILLILNVFSLVYYCIVLIKWLCFFKYVNSKHNYIISINTLFIITINKINGLQSYYLLTEENLMFVPIYCIVY